MNQRKTVVLFRPVGPLELELIQQSDWSAFPQRLHGQPIFYPVLNEEYAAQIAREWNVKESGAGCASALMPNFSKSTGQR